MAAVTLVRSTQGHLPRIFQGLMLTGWKLIGVPNDHKIPRNGAKVVLRSDGLELRLRLFAYKVTTSGRSKPHERRIEITSTYRGGLKRARGYRDAVIGVDVDGGKYVGVDAKRLHMGGSTHNASSFFDLEGLSASKGSLRVNPRDVSSTAFSGKVEYHGFFDNTRLAEYLFNIGEIHAGTYSFAGAFQGRARIRNVALPARIDQKRAAGDCFIFESPASKGLPQVESSVIEAIEQNDYSALRRRKITPAELKRILSACDEVGALGEQVVLSNERRRLQRLGFSATSARVERVSLTSVGEGFDILSFEDDGRTSRFLEVKSTVGRRNIIDISAGEWKCAKKFRERYYIVRVTNVRDSPRLRYVRDPYGLHLDGRIDRTPTGWRLDLDAISEP